MPAREVDHLEVSDDGCGFITDDAGQGYGLLGKRERVELLDPALAPWAASS